MKRGWIVLFVALALFIGFEDVLGANCAIWPCNCGDTLTASVTMGGDLSCTSDGLIVGASSITLDCAGYSINRTNFNSDYGVRSFEHVNLIIKNCKFNNFSRAINIDFSANNLILNNTINNSIVYGISLDVNNSQIENNSVYNTNDKGIFLSGSNNNLTSNFVAQSADIGIMVGNGEDGSYNTTLIRNIIVNSGGNGLYFYSQANYTTFLNNTVQNNTAYGLRFLASSSLFENNTFISNNLEDGQGFYVGGSSNKIYRNIFIEHDTNALQLGGSNASVQYNTFNHSSNNGSGIIDSYTPVSATLINQILHNTIYGYSKGVSLSSRYSLVQNNTLTNNTYAVFIDGAGSNEGDYNNVTQNIMANNTYGVYFQYLADYNIINDNVIKNNSYGITFFPLFSPAIGWLYRTENNTLSNNKFIINSIMDITAPNGTTATFLNNTYRPDNISVGVNSTLYFSWYVDVNVTNLNASGITNANITAKNISIIQEQSLLTNQQGSARLSLIEYSQTETTKTYRTPHTINVTLGGSSNQTTLNLTITNSTSINFVLPLNDVSCSNLSSGVVLSASLNSNGSCFIITASNIIIDGNNLALTGNGTGTAINITNKENVTIRNINIYNFSTAINLENSFNITLTGVSISNSSEGIFILNTTHSTIYSNTLFNNSQNATKIANSTSNLLYNNRFFNNTQNVFDNDTNQWNTTLNCSGLSNILGFSCIGGNSFDDYSGNDTNRNGIGDTSFSITGGLNFDQLPLVDIPDLCTSINESTTLPANSLITTTRTCITITQNNVVLDGNNATLQGDGGYTDFGVLVNTQANLSNITIKNLNLKNFGFGIFIACDSRNPNKCYNVTIQNTTSIIVYEGIRLSGVRNSNISNNNIKNLTTYFDIDTYGILVESSNDNILSHNNISSPELSTIATAGETGGLKFINANNNTLQNSHITMSDIASDIRAQTGTNYVINTSLNKENISAGPNTQLYLQWFIDVNITNNADGAISGATATAARSDNSIDHTTLSDSNGISRLTLTEFYKENNVKYITTPHIIKATKPGYVSNQTTQTISQSATLNLSIVAFSCGDTIAGDLIIGANLTATSNCITVGTNNLTIDGAGYTINSSGQNLYGINLSSWAGIKIKNITLQNFQTAIFLRNSNSTNISDITLLNGTYGIYFENSTDNEVFSGNFTNNSFDVFAINDGTTNNSIINSSLNVSSIQVNGTASIYIRDYVDVNTTFNGGYPLQNVNVTAYFNSTNQLDQQGFTTSDGIVRLKLAAQKVNSTGIFNLIPHNITALYRGVSTTQQNSTIINSSLVKYVPLTFNLSCLIPSSYLNITQNTTLCPGTYTLTSNGLIVGSSNINILCDETTISTTSNSEAGFSLNGVDNVTMSGCGISGFRVGILATNIERLNLSSFLFSSITTNLMELDDTKYSTFTDIAQSSTDTIELLGSSHNTFENVSSSLYLTTSTTTGEDSDNNTFYLHNSTSITIENGDQNNFYNMTLSSASSYGVLIRENSLANLFYHNIFTNNQEHIFDENDEGNNFFNYSVNISGTIYNQGNSWDDYCNKGLDLDSDGFADNDSSVSVNDWPYNDVISSKIYYIVDYHPKIQECVTEVQLGSSSSSGGGSSSASRSAESTAPSSAPISLNSHAKSAPYKSAPSEVSYESAQEVAKYVQRKITTTKKDGKILEVKVILTNTGDKMMKLTPKLLQDSDDPFYIVKTKTLGTKSSLFSQISGVWYSSEPIAGKLLEARLLGSDEFKLEPGETKDFTLELEQGFNLVRQVKIQFTYLGDVAFEEELEVEQNDRISGAAVDIDIDNHNLDIYAIIVPTGLIKSFNGDSSDLITGAAVGEMNSPSDNYYIEINLNSATKSSSLFADFYGPYTIKENRPFIFAQQISYDKAVYRGEYILVTKVYQGKDMLVENKFDISLE